MQETFSSEPQGHLNEMVFNERLRTHNLTVKVKHSYRNTKDILR